MDDHEIERGNLEITQPEVNTGNQGLSPQPRFLRRAGFVRRIVSTVLAFTLGLGSGYALWGREAAPSNTDKTEVSAPAATESHTSEMDLASLSKQVNPLEGYTLPVKYGNIGPRLIAAGAIDYESFVQVYKEAGSPLTETQLTLLTQGSDDVIVIDRDNAYFLLNFFWAVGLTNQNRVLTEGPMMQGGKDQIGRFASTAGWTIGAKPATELYASIPIIELTPRQQRRLEEVTTSVYRPCCNNPTHFPDCNHGMAMLGLLELMASRDTTSEEMLAAAKYFNAFWYPQQTLEQAVYFKMTKGQDFAQVEARQVVGPNFSSASGFQWVHRQLADSGVLKQIPDGGSSCGVQ